MRKIAAIINTGAGSAQGENLRDKLASLFEQQGVQARILTASGVSLRDNVRRLRDEGFDVIAAGGGDGTLSTVASELVGHTAALGVLPLGTLNHFARDLGVPMDAEQAVEVLCSGEISRVDVGTVNEHVFINNSSLGVYPDQVRVRQAWQEKIGKLPAMVFASMVVLSRFPFLRITAEFNGKRISRRCPMVMISNNEYSLEPGRLAERDYLNNGRLGIYMLREEGRAGLLKMAFHALVFRLEEAESFEIHSAPEVVINTRRRRVRVALDGEVHRLSSPLIYRTLPGGLRVVVPPKRSQT